MSGLCPGLITGRTRQTGRKTEIAAAAEKKKESPLLCRGEEGSWSVERVDGGHVLTRLIRLSSLRSGIHGKIRTEIGIQPSSLLLLLLLCCCSAAECCAQRKIIAMHFCRRIFSHRTFNARLDSTQLEVSNRPTAIRSRARGAS